MTQITPQLLHQWLADTGRKPPVLLDVREPWEFEHCRIEGSVSIPLAQLPARRELLPENRDLVLVCHHGVRSQQAALWLARNGFANLHNLAGGVEAWAVEVDPAMPRY